MTTVKTERDTIQIKCPIDGSHDVPMYVHPSQYAGMWTCVAHDAQDYHACLEFETQHSVSHHIGLVNGSETVIENEGFNQVCIDCGRVENE